MSTRTVQPETDETAHEMTLRLGALFRVQAALAYDLSSKTSYPGRSMVSRQAAMLLGQSVAKDEQVTDPCAEGP